MTIGKGPGVRPRSFGFTSRICALFSALCLALPLIASLIASVDADAEAAIRMTGYLDRRNSESGVEADGNIVIDHATGKAFQINAQPKPKLLEYSLSDMRLTRQVDAPLILAAETRAGRVEWLTAMDSANRRLFAFQVDQSTFPETYRLFHFNLETLKASASSSLWPGADRIPLAISYHRPTDRVYILTRVSNLDSLGSVFFVEERTVDGSLVWAHRLAPCFSALDQQYPPTLVRSVIEPANIYLNCYNSSGIQSQVVRVRLDEGGQPIQGGEDVYPAMPRALSTMFDPATDRMFFLTTNSGAGRGAWVFDGLRSSFLGVIATGDNGRGAFDYSMGLDPVTGRLYLHTPVGLLVADGRRVPLGGGLLFRQYAQQGVGMIQIDPINRRVFLPDGQMKNRVQRPSRYIVLKDEIPISADPPAGNPDSLTQDLEEAPGVTEVNMSGTARSFAARSLTTGGIQRGLWNLALGQISPEDLELVRDAIAAAPLDERNRDTYGARVRSASLTNDSADASAAVGEADEGTLKDLNRAEMRWPFDPAQCQDDGTKPTTGSANGGLAGTSCDAEGSLVKASASAPGFPNEEGDLITARTLYSDASVTKDPARGLVARSSALVSDLSILDGRVKIGQLATEASAAAKGRPGSARATFIRRVSNLEVDFDDDGKADYSCETCDISRAEETINRALAGIATISFPSPDGAYFPKGSPGGYQSVVEKDRFVYFADRALNDDDSKEVPGAVLTFPYDARAGRSRQTIQLASVQAEAHYGIFLIPKAEGQRDLVAFGSETFALPKDTTEDLGDLIAFTPPTTAATHAEPIIERIVRKIANGWRLFMTRPGDAVLLAAFWLLLLAPGYLIHRRRFLGELD